MVKEVSHGEAGCHHALLTILKASREHQDMENPGNGYLRSSDVSRKQFTRA